MVSAFAHGAMGRRSFIVDPLSYILFQPVLHDWCNKDCGMWDGAYKRTLAANRYLSGPLTYV